jgi:uncharacterized protein (DUF433 family)
MDVCMDPRRRDTPTAMKELVIIDPEILGGTPVFRGTRVPVQTLFDYLERDYTLAEFLECFPTVTREMACAVLEDSEATLLAPVAA